MLPATWGSLEVDECAFPSLREIAKMLARHTSLSSRSRPTATAASKRGRTFPWEGSWSLHHAPGLAREYTKRRANAVRTALLEQAATTEVMLVPNRVVTKAWECSRPLVWAFVDEAYDPSGINVDEEASARNRRVDLHLRSGGFEVPQRRRRSEIAVEPGKLPLEDGSSDGEKSEEDDKFTAPQGMGTLGSYVMWQMGHWHSQGQYLLGDSEDEDGRSESEEEDGSNKSGDGEIESW